MRERYAETPPPSPDFPANLTLLEYGEVEPIERIRPTD
jgi:hypothetical protein